MRLTHILEKIKYILKNLKDFHKPNNFFRLLLYFFIKGEITILEWDLLYKLAGQVKDNCIVEIGSYKGKSTISLALGSKFRNIPIFAIDPHDYYVDNKIKKFTPDSRVHFIKNMLLFGISRQVRLINLSSVQAAKAWNKKISLLFIDGNHEYKEVKKDFENWEECVVKNGILILHDATTKGLGPERVLQDILKKKKYKKIKQVDQMVVLKKIRS